MDWGAWNGLMTNAMHTAKMHALVLGWGHVRKKALVHAFWYVEFWSDLDTHHSSTWTSCSFLCLIGGAAWVSERGVLVRKENRSGVRKGSCD